MKRRTFIAGFGSAAAWPVVARAQQGERLRIGVLMPGDENDPLWKTRYSAFTQGLASLGWTDGRNVRIELRWDRGDINRIRVLAQELVGLQPDIILASTTPATVAVQRETHNSEFHLNRRQTVLPKADPVPFSSSAVTLTMVPFASLHTVFGKSPDYRCGVSDSVTPLAGSSHQ